MSVRVMTLVWSLDLPDSQKIVLLALADSANDEGHCWPSMASLTKKCSKSERTIQGVIKELVDAGHLTRQENPGKGCNYYVHPRSDCTPAETAPPQRLRQTPAAAADKPSRTIISGLSDDKPKRASRAKAGPILPDWMPGEAWNGYVAMRTRIRKPLTDRAIELLIGKLELWRADGHDPGGILDTATEHSWTGIYLPKENRDAARNDSPDAWRGSSGRNQPDNRDGFTRAIDRRAFGSGGPPLR